jgi:hypothetical protein
LTDSGSTHRSFGRKSISSGWRQGQEAHLDDAFRATTNTHRVHGLWLREIQITDLSRSSSSEVPLFPRAEAWKATATSHNKCVDNHKIVETWTTYPTYNCFSILACLWQVIVIVILIVIVVNCRPLLSPSVASICCHLSPWLICRHD